jgi:hypothetical protein
MHKSILGSVLLFIFVSKLYAGNNITYYPTIFNIVNQHCSPCHRAGENTPFVLYNYDDVSKRAATILQAINNNIMPPWPADPTYVKYHKQNVLSEQEKQMIQQWIDGGKIKGKVPKSESAASNSNFKSDIILQIAPRESMGNTNQDIYEYGILDWYFKSPVSIKDYIFKIKTPFLHHSEILSVLLDTLIHPNTSGYTKTNSYENKTVITDKYIMGWFPGSSCGILPEGTKMTLDTGKKFMVVLHYIPTARTFIDSSELLIQTTDKSGLREVHEFAVHGTYQYLKSTNHQVFIPANTIQTFHFTEIVPNDISAFAVYGHAHHLCKNMLAFAITPLGDTIHLLRINNWKFNWQMSYRFDKFMKIPKGSVVHFIATYDNTSANPENLHNPPKDVYASFMADDEMMEFFILYLSYLPQDETKILKYND